MINSKFGIFLSSIRREKGITARQLAAELLISEKTLELWESGRRYPELTVLPRIAEILGVTPVELINGERNPKGYVSSPEEEALVRDMISYAERVTTYKTSGMTFVAISVLLIVGVLTCFLVNFLIERSLSWALFPFGGALVVWLTAAPLFLAKKTPRPPGGQRLHFEFYRISFPDRTIKSHEGMGLAFGTPALWGSVRIGTRRRLVLSPRERIPLSRGRSLVVPIWSSGQFGFPRPRRVLYGLPYIVCVSNCRRCTLPLRRLCHAVCGRNSSPPLTSESGISPFARP